MKNLIYIILTLIFTFAFAESIQAQSPSSFKYQGVVRNTDGEIMKDATIALKLSVFVEGSFTAYSEEYVDLKTNKAGVFSVNIGSGDFVMGNATTVEEIDWNGNNYSLLVEMDTDLDDGSVDYLTMGVSPILAVPYALHAKTVENADDADADPANELQELNYDPTTNRLEISDGNFVNVNEFINDFEDQDNQTLSIVNTTLEISNGNQIELGHLQDGVNDADSNPENEIQTLNLAGNVLSLVNTNGEIQNSVTLNPGQVSEVSWTDINGIPASIQDGDDTEDADSDPNNEMQTLTLSPAGELQLLDAAGEVYSIVELPEVNNPLSSWGALTGIPSDLQDGDDVDDADANPTNEIQTLVYSGTTLELINADGTTESSVEISTGQDADADPLNEIQYLELNGTSLSLKDVAGNEQSTVILPSGPGGTNDWNELNNVPADLQDGDDVDDADADSENELQTLQIDGQVLSILNADGTVQNSVPIPVTTDGGSGDGDNDATNELQDWSTLPGIPADLQDGDQVDDADASAENEIQSLQIDGQVLSILNADGTIQNSVPIPVTTDSGSGDGDNDATNELQDWGTLPGIPADLLDGDQVDDADADATNEMQTLSFDGTNISLEDAAGNDYGTFPLPSVAEVDGDVTNEIQAIQRNGDFIEMLNPDGTVNSFVSDQVNDADSDNTNELQTLSFDGTNISLEDASGNDYGTFPLPSVAEVDGDVTNEIQAIQRNGDFIEMLNPDGTVNSFVSDQVNDADSDDTNELQAIFLNGNDIELLNPDGSVNSSVNLPGGTDSQDLSVNANSLTITNGDNVLLDDINYWQKDGADVTYNGGAKLTGGVVGDNVDIDGNGFKFFAGDSPTADPWVEIGFNGFEMETGSAGIKLDQSELVGSDQNGHKDFVINKDEIALRRPSTGTLGTFSAGATGILKPGELKLSTGGSLVLNRTSTLSANSLSFTNIFIGADPLTINGSGGEITRVSSGGSDMLVKGYSTISAAGNIISGSNNLTVTKTGDGRYDITVNNSTSANFSVTVTPKPFFLSFGGFTSTSPRIANYAITGGGVIRVYTFTVDGTAIDAEFTVQIMEE